MDLKEIGINARNWVDSAKDRDYWRAVVNEAPPGSISHGVSWLLIFLLKRVSSSLLVSKDSEARFSSREMSSSGKETRCRSP